MCVSESKKFAQSGLPIFAILNRVPAVMFFVMVLMCPIMMPVYAQNIDGRFVYQFSNDYIERLKYYYEGMKITEQILSEIRADRQRLGAESIARFQQATESFMTAKKKIAGYLNFKNDDVITCLMSALVSYQQQSEANLKSIRLIVNIASPPGGIPLPENVVYTTLESIQKQRLSAIETLLDSSVMLTYLMIDQKLNLNRRVKSLVLSRAERDLLVDSIEKSFGSDLQMHFSEKAPLSLAPVFALHKMLHNATWMLADEVLAGARG